MFRYKIAARENAINSMQSLIIGIFVTFGIGKIFEETVIIPAIFWFIAFIIGLVLIKNIFLLIFGGVWLVEVNDNSFIYKTPLFSGGSFTIPLDNIECIVKEIEYEKELDQGKLVIDDIDYYIDVKGNTRHYLTNESGVNLESLVDALKESGVPLKVDEKDYPESFLNT